MSIEKWQALNFILSENINSSISEQLYESKVIQAFGELGWKEYLGDIKVRPSYRIGSSRSIEPDLVFRIDNHENLFVVEIKRPDISLSSTFQDQLFSYMRQLKLEYGILIGEKIQLFYDGDLNKQENPILLETINFERENKLGVRFTELFDKSNFNEDSLKEFTIESLKKLNSKEEHTKLTKILLSEDFKEELFKLIKQNFIDDYSVETIDSVLENVDIDITNSEKKSKISKRYNKPDSFYYKPTPTKPLYSGRSSNTETLLIELNPSDEYDFKRRLLRTKTAWITTYYTDGRKEKHIWNAYMFKESSNLLGNLRSRPNFRNGKWQKLGISRVYVSIDND